MKARARLIVAVILLILALSPFSPAVLSASARQQFIVVVDAGHGGMDPGGIGWLGVSEKDINLAIARLVELEALSEPELRIVLTRRGDVYVPLEERTALANRLGAALYVSIHANIHTDWRVKGIETILPDTWQGQNWRSLVLARSLQARLVAGLRSDDRGVKYQPLYLRSSRVPAALVEVGFLSNPEEALKLQSFAYQDRIARAILEGIKEFLGLR
ncbi:MAG: N-acetylmuramoyl-L-alanine amidase [Candidatus Acetothermia bacterium]|jgi:N-acetylmuramoyl-L-alanine amidase|nr:N-acetylmuramoyl-L-alanine amidase [Candidatus Acetothermia bacterium]MDH7505500.1 N-acetylmuramoyl-L-alanine amidase [Candidatus Acetothermia bacterium]